MCKKMKRTFWHNDATPVENTLDRVMYEIKFDDTEGLLLDSVSLADIIEDSDGLMTFDALVTPYARLPAKMDILQRVMIRAGTTVQPLNYQCSEPFMQNGTANVAAIFELSDGQTISIFFHNPDTTPKKILPTDELISWKWLLNKKDITIVVAPEKGLDLNPRQVAVRIMKLAEKNSASFIRSNSKRAERMQALEDLKTEITGLEGDLKGALHRLEVAKVEKEDRDMAAVEPVKIDWAKAENLDTTEKIRAIGIAMIDEIGNENVYVVKDGKPYYFKPGNTDHYAVGKHDFSGDDAYGEIDTDPELTATEEETNEQELGIDADIFCKDIIDSPLSSAELKKVAGAYFRVQNRGPLTTNEATEFRGFYSTIKGNQLITDLAAPTKIMSISETMDYLIMHFKTKVYGYEQTNEQTEVETETEAAGTEGGVAKGKIQSVEQLVDIALSRKDGNKAFAEIGEITQDVAEKVKQVTGIDVTGWVHGIDEAAIRHIIKEHGDNLVEESRGQIAVTPQDISRINEIVQNPDSIEKGYPLPNGNETVIYKKTIEGTSIYVQEMRDGRRKLTAKTMWKVRAVPPATVETGLVHTSETSSTQPPQDDKNIPQSENNAINNEKSLIDAYINSYQASADKINMAIEAIDWSAIVDFKSGDVEEDKLRNTSNKDKDIEIAQNNLRDANIDYDRDLIYESLQFKAYGDAIMAYRAATSKIAELSKAAAIKNGKDKLKNLPENATLEDKAAAVFESIGIKGASADRIINAINNADIDSLRSFLGNLDNKASRAVFEIAIGIKLEKTVKGTLVQIDEWAGITPEQRITINADKQAIRDKDSLLSDLKYAWIPLEHIKVNTGKSMQDWIASTYNDGYTNIEKQKKGAATSYYMTNKEHGAIGFKKSKAFNSFLKSALAFGENDETLGMKKALKALNIDIAGEELTQVERVNKAYLFNGTDDFKEWLAESIDKTEYSPFLTAKTMDEAAKHNGASIEWGFFGGLSKEEENHLFGKTLDGVSDNDGIDIPIFDEDELGNSYSPDSDDDTVLDSVVMDGIDQTGYVGKILKYGVIAGRIDIGEDGKALVFIGENGDNRVKTKSGIDFMYSDLDVAEMVDLLLNSHQESQAGDDILPDPMSEPEPITPIEPAQNETAEIEAEITALRALIGTFEFSDALDNLLDKLEAAGLDGDYEKVVSDIIELDAQAENAKIGA